jgi:hypothetical protein
MQSSRRLGATRAPLEKANSAALITDSSGSVASVRTSYLSAKGAPLRLMSRRSGKVQLHDTETSVGDFGRPPT